MKQLLPLILLVLAFSCRSQKEVQRETIVYSDSVATTVSHRSFASLDSVMARLYFDFDTLEVEWNSEMRIEEGQELGNGDPESQIPGSRFLTSTPKRLRVIKGRVASNRSQYRQAEVAKTSLDSTSHKQRSADSSAEHTATTAVYNPPNTTAIICVTLALALLFVFSIIYIRKK